MISQDASSNPRDASDPLSAHPSPIRSTPDGAPPWPRPRTPIPPHRLAKLANALGISTPVPLSLPQNDPAQSSTPEPRRSPAPSIASTLPLPSHSPSPLLQSKFLLHVVPPSHIPHDSDSSETFHLTPPPPAASGYHTQFERGTLVPLLPTLQSQLWAIAKEYAFPSTTGMILYLVSSAPSPNPDTTLTIPDEPGPRLSEDIWRHLWTRVAKFEAETYTNTAVGLGFGYIGPPSPLFSQPFSSTSNTLRPLISPSRVVPQSVALPLTPTGSTVSSNPPTQATFSESSLSEVDTPDSSLPSDSRAATLDLPGLTSPSLIPILAKVEFDIDKRRAAWYGPWIRSRKLNHQKREHRARTASDSGTPITGEGDGEVDTLKVAPLPLRLVDRQAIPRFLLSAGDGDEGSDYPRLSESPPVLEDDPVSIALSGPAKTEGDSVNGNDDDEVRALRESQDRPRLAVDTPSSPTGAMVLPSLPTEGMVTTGTYKKAPPPPLTLMPYSFGMSAAEPSPLPSSSSTGLAYLRDGVSTSSDGDKRTGTVFDELDLGLDFEDTGEFDEDDPNDQRRSQYVLKAKLDEIEKTLVRLSPRTLLHESEPQDQPVKSPSRSSLSSSSVNGPTPGSVNSPPLPSDASRQGPPEQESKAIPSSLVWPTVPHSSLRQRAAKAGSSSGLDNLLPKLSLNGVPNPMPVSPYKKSFSELEEFKPRRREPNGHEPTYHEIVASSSREPTSASSPIIPLSPDPFRRYPSTPSPPSASFSTFLEIPLKAKYSAAEAPEQHASGSHSHKDSVANNVDAVSRPPSSRFSLDSTDEGTSANNRTSASLNPVKSIKSLWKRGRKASISSGSGSAAASQTGPGPPSPLLSPPPPPVPSISSTSTPRSLTPSTASRESVASLVLPSDRHASKALHQDTPLLSTKQLQQSRSTPSISSMVFNQESPYPVHVVQSKSTSRLRTASQTARIHSSVSLAEVDVTPPPSASLPATDKEKASVPKSILKPRRTESSANPLPLELHMARRSQSRTDPVVRRSTTSGGGRTTPPASASESTRISPTKSRRRSNRTPVPSRPSQDDEAVDSVPRLDVDQRS